jgi:hypothetical protein
MCSGDLSIILQDFQLCNVGSSHCRVHLQVLLQPSCWRVVAFCSTICRIELYNQLSYVQTSVQRVFNAEEGHAPFFPLALLRQVLYTRDHLLPY